VLTGSVGDGPVIGANIQLRDRSGNLMAEMQSDAKAAYNITVATMSEDFPLLLEATGGTDLVTNRAPDFKLTGAAFNTGSQSVANLSPFSTFAVALTKYMSGGTTTSNLENAQETVSSALNSGLDSLVATGPMSTPIDAGNIAEMVKASETLSEIVRRTRDHLVVAGFTTNHDSTVAALASDLTDGVIDGLGGSDTDKRASAVSTIVAAQVLLESMANELHVLGTNATVAMSDAINQVSPATPSITLDELPVTAGMIAKARIGLAAAFAINEDPAIRQLHAIVSDLQAGQNSSIVRVALPSNYRSVLSGTLDSIATADGATIDLVNSIARTDGNLDPDKLAPSIQGTPATSVLVGGFYSFTPSASDPNGDPLTFSVAGAPSWTSFDGATGQLSGTPTTDDVGVYPDIVISVSDGEFSASLGAFQISVAVENTAPTISGTPASSVDAGNEYAFTPTAADAEGDTLSFTIANQPPWASFDASTGTVGGTPSNEDAGTYSDITITTSDGEFSASLAAFSITVNAVTVNTAPTISGTPASSVDTISGTPASSVDAGNEYAFTPTAADAEGDTLSFTIANQPPWASFDAATGTLGGTPTNEDAGSYSDITITASDGEFSASLAAFSITVNAVTVNTAPTISGTPASSVNEGQDYTFTPNASDADDDTLTFSVSGLPVWASFDESTGTLSGTPGAGDVGVYSNISITVSDGQASATLGPFDITVDAISLGSVTLNWTAPTQNEDGTTLTDLAGYKLYWGTTPGNYTESVTIENASVLTYVVENLAPGTYEFVATSFNTSGVESRYSGAATKIVQ
jgi:hypothetical protein